MKKAHGIQKCLLDLWFLQVVFRSLNVNFHTNKIPGEIAGGKCAQSNWLLTSKDKKSNCISINISNWSPSLGNYCFHGESSPGIWVTLRALELTAANPLLSCINIFHLTIFSADRKDSILGSYSKQVSHSLAGSGMECNLSDATSSAQTHKTWSPQRSPRQPMLILYQP